jgi:hypothetical protein
MSLEGNVAQRRRYHRGVRDWFLGAVLSVGLAALVLTEFFGALGLLERGPLALAWIAVALAAAWKLRGAQRPGNPGWFDSLILAAIAAVAATVLAVALLSPPNSTDAMGYHMPRVVYWAQAGRVAFFPVHYIPQISQPPLAEYLILHTYLLSGGDRLANLVQWFAFFASGVAASAVAADLGAARRGQFLAALFAATLPNGILQASGVKNDCVLTLWLTLAARYSLAWLRDSKMRDLAAASAALGLAILTKNTAYLFGAPLLACLWAPLWRSPRRLACAVCIVTGCTVAINGPHYWRNLTLSGSILGFRSAEGDDAHPRLAWRPDAVTPRGAASNLLRFSAEHLGARSEAWNRAVYGAVLDAHRWLGVDPHDPTTTWLDVTFAPPRVSNHEADAPNRLHLAGLLTAPILILAVRRERGFRWRFWTAIALGFVVFCVALRWQPYTIRLQLPLFVLGSALLGALIGDLRYPLIHAAVALLALDGARLPLLENWVRPLRGERSLLRTGRDDSYFADMTRYAKREEYREAVRGVLESRCKSVGIDNSRFHLEYPFQALLLAADPSIRFRHAGVANASKRYDGGGFAPCAVFCPDCAANPEMRQRYAAVGPPVEIGRSLLFVAQGLHRVEPRGAAGWQPAGQQARSAQHGDDDGERRRVARRHQDDSRHQLRDGQRRRQAENHPDRQLLQSAAQHHAGDIAEARAQRHTHADLLRPASHRVCHHRVEADGRHNQGDQGED